MAFWKNEKGVLGPLAAKENAPYRNCGGRFSRVAGWRGVFAQSVTSAATSWGLSLTSDQEPHRHNQAHKQGENPQRIQGGEPGRTLGVDWGDKGGDESAFVRIGSKYSFLHG